ncbi:hypothetical protein ACFS32_10950 [Novosphingobium pokkalii]|uniref:hypothetical protein n=1 Tax=Novosphingobium pokkalii TaxID=1770194 RepID=UPI003635AAC7
MDIDAAADPSLKGWLGSTGCASAGVAINAPAMPAIANILIIAKLLVLSFPNVGPATKGVTRIGLNGHGMR